MKKISLLLISLFVCSISWAQTTNSTPGFEYGLNPYAYDVAVKSWDVNTKKLTLTFKLNSVPNLGSNEVSDGNRYNPGQAFNEGQGIQIYAIDPTNGEEYRIGGPSRADITNATNNGSSYEYVCTLTSGKCTHGDKTLPLNKSLDVQVLVKGRSQGELVDGQYIGRANPELVTKRPAGFQSPGDVLSVAINKNIQSPNFAKTYITNSNSNAFWQYTAQMTDKAVVGTSSLIAPHRVRVSDDGRVFLSSYDINAGAAVVEYLGNNQFNTIVKFDPSSNRRVVSLDVKGSAENITLLVAWLTNQGKVECWEYPLGFDNDNILPTEGEKVAEYEDATLSTLLIQGVAAEQGFVGVAYGQGTNNPIWMKLDFAAGQDNQARILYFNNSSVSPKNTIKMPKTYYSTTGHYGGNALLVTNNQLITAAGNGKVLVYDIVSEGNLESLPYEVALGENVWMNDLAIDYAYNIYGVSSCNDQLYTISLPYSGKQGTIAPKKRTNIFAMPSNIPNILATDLRYVPHPYLDRYIFSFNVNTKPAIAELRFYNSYEKMKNSINVVHDDLYNGTNATTPDFVYVIPTDKLRQGKISVELKMAGGKIADGKLVGDAMPPLPPGEWYWSVYVEAPCRSTKFAPIYTQPAVADPHRQHATVDNNPENDGFGHIYVADHHNIAIAANRKHYVKAYTIANATGAGTTDNQTNINDNTRYGVSWQVKSNNKVHFTRRPVVAPDGMVYIADEGSNQKNAYIDWFREASLSTYCFLGAGLHVLDPSKQTNNADADWEANFSVPHEKTGNQEVTTGASFLYKDGAWKLYRTNTYDEFTLHPGEDGVAHNYQNAKWNTNGYRVYTLTSDANGLVHSGYEDNVSPTVKVPFGAGDANGQFSIVATKNGVWMCQHRANTVATAPVVDGNKQLPDNKENILLSFFDHSGARKFTSLTYDGGNLTQKETSPFQSAPGAGMAYQERNGVEYLYVINHNGYILEFKITGGNNPQLTLTQKYLLGKGTKGDHGAVSSMNFDYAGNLVVTAGQTYGTSAKLQVGDPNVLINRDHQDLVIYTMPYPNRVNAQEIQAPNSCRFIPERLSQNDMKQKHIDAVVTPYFPSGTCYLDLYRPLQGGTFNTITLPFDLASLNNTPYAGAEVRRFTGTELKNVGGENLLYFNFEKVTFSGDDIMKAGKPYVIMPQKDVVGIVSFKNARVQFKTQYSTELAGGDEYGKFVGFFPYQEMASNPKTLMLVSDNRLAEIEEGTMNGFRAYFHLLKAVPANTLSMLHFKKDTPTGMEIVVDGKVVNVEKLIREGRVYIRAGETLYTITGEVVSDRR